VIARAKINARYRVSYLRGLIIEAKPEQVWAIWVKGFLEWVEFMIILLDDKQMIRLAQQAGLSNSGRHSIE
jgi:hypothetical protein